MVLKSGSEKAETVMKAAVGRSNGIETPPGPVKNEKSRADITDPGKQKSALKKTRPADLRKVKKREKEENSTS